MALLFAGCSSVASPRSDAPAASDVKLPQFETQDLDGKRIGSQQLARKTVVVAFFDPESVLAWRTLSKLSQSFGKAPVSLLAVAGAKPGSDQGLNISALRDEYKIAFPLIVDRENQLSKTFGAPGCCDYLYVYDSVGTRQSSQRLSESYNNLPASLVELKGDPPVTNDPKPSKEVDLYSHLKLSSKDQVVEPLPLATNGVTVVNLFDEFSTECPTGSRFQTLRRLSHIHGAAGRIVAVFSKANFSEQDTENFEIILPTTFPLRQGDIEDARPYLVRGNLLIVFDANKNVVWRERADMGEQQVFGEVAKFLQTTAQ
jgi:peroxiredoxin